MSTTTLSLPAINKSNWKPWKSITKGIYGDSNDKNDAESKDITKISASTNNLFDSINIYSALESKEKLENSCSYLPTLETLVKKYSINNNTPDSERTNSVKRPKKVVKLKKINLRKFSRVHLTDTNLAREKSFIENSSFSQKSQPNKSDTPKGMHVKKVKRKKQKLEIKANNSSLNESKSFKSESIVMDSLPDLSTVYNNQNGLESRKNSFINENLKRLTTHQIPFCEYTKEAALHEKDSKESICPYCSNNQQQSKTSIKLPSIRLNDSSMDFHSDTKEFNQVINALTPPEKYKKTFFCDILGEKYCNCCTECHERRFAKLYEKKYMTDSDPIKVATDLLKNQRLSDEKPDKDSKKETKK